MANHYRFTSRSCVCEVCGETFPERRYVDRHVALEHSGGQRAFYLYAQAETKNLIELIEAEINTLKDVHTGKLIKSTVDMVASCVSTIASLVRAFGGPPVSPSIYSVVSAAEGVTTHVTKHVGGNTDTLRRQSIDRIQDAIDFYAPVAQQLGRGVPSLAYEECEDNSLMRDARVATTEATNLLKDNWTTSRRGLTKVLRSVDVSKKTAYKASVKTLKVATGTIAAVGGAIQVVEMGCLLKEWISEPSETKPLKELIGQLKLIAAYLREVLVTNQ